MDVPYDAMVVIADGRKLLMLRNRGDAAHLDLQVVQKQLHPNPKTSDQKTDSSGASHAPHGGGAPGAAGRASFAGRRGGTRPRRPLAARDSVSDVRIQDRRRARMIFPSATAPLGSAKSRQAVQARLISGEL